MTDPHAPARVRPRLLGAVLAGGRSSRYGSSKARATVGGVPLAQRARDALGDVVPRVVLVAGDPTLATDLGLDDRPDWMPGAGPLGGVATALRWTADEGYEGALVLACDLPLVPSGLLELLMNAWDGRSVVAPASPGPLGMEPLVAAYPLATLQTLEAALRAGTRSMSEALRLVPTKTLAAERVSALGDPRQLFLNVNRPGDRDRAERVLANGGL